MSVPCNGCTLCCHADAIMLFPDQGDDVASYDTVEFELPGTGEVGSILKHQENGTCIYLGSTGCTIYDRRPLICRTFDCRLWFKSHSRIERRRMVRDGVADQEIFDRGRELLPTLETQP